MEIEWGDLGAVKKRRCGPGESGGNKEDRGVVGGSPHVLGEVKKNWEGLEGVKETDHELGEVEESEGGVETRIDKLQ